MIGSCVILSATKLTVQSPSVLQNIAQILHKSLQSSLLAILCISTVHFVCDFI